MVHSFPTRRSSDLGPLPGHGGARRADGIHQARARSEEHTSELQSHHPISYAVFCLKKKKDDKINQCDLRLPKTTEINLPKQTAKARGIIICWTSYLQLRFFGLCFFFLMIRRPPRSTLDGTLFPTRRSSDLRGGRRGAGRTGDVAGGAPRGRRRRGDRKSTRLNSSHTIQSRMPSSA